MPRPSFYELYQRVLEEGSFWDMIANHARTGWNLGRSIAPKPYVPGWLARRLASQPPPEVNTDPFGSEHDDPFGLDADDPFSDEHGDPFAAADDPFDEPRAAAPSAVLPLPTGKSGKGKRQPQQPQQQGAAKMKRFYPFGAFSPFYIEKPMSVRKKGLPGRVGTTVVANDNLLRKIRAQYHKH